MGPELDSKPTPKEKILQATFEIIGSKGVQAVTTRKIAARAGVNVAAVNYYFGSKDNVINEALKIFTSKLLSPYLHLDDTTLPPVERLRNFLRSYADSTLEYPDVFQNFIEQVMRHSDLSFEYIEFLKKVGWEKLEKLIREITLAQDGEDILRMKIFQMFSSLEFPVLIGVEMESLSQFDYYDRECRYQYVELVLKSLLSR